MERQQAALQSQLDQVSREEKNCVFNGMLTFYIDCRPRGRNSNARCRHCRDRRPRRSRSFGGCAFRIRCWYVVEEVNAKYHLILTQTGNFSRGQRNDTCGRRSHCSDRPGGRRMVVRCQRRWQERRSISM